MKQRANNKMIKKLITYVKDDLDSVNGEIAMASKKHLKPRENRINAYMGHIEFLLKGIKNEFKFQKES